MFPELVPRRIYSQQNIELYESAQNVSLDITLLIPGPEVPGTARDPSNRLADVLLILQNEPQSMTIQPVTTTAMTFDGSVKKSS